METSQILQQAINAISLGAIYSLFALGYALVFSVLGVLNLAHSAIFAWGAFLGLVVTEALGLSIWIGFLLAMIGAGLLSAALELVAFRPLRRRNAPRISQLISSIGAAILLVNIAQLLYQELFGKAEGAYQRLLDEPIIIEGLDLRITPIRMIVLVVALVLMILLQYLVRRTRVGQSMRAVSFDHRVAGLLGINVGWIFLLTFFLAGALGGAAGVMYGLVFVNVTPFIGQTVALTGLTAIVLGGLGNIQGAVLGGFIVAGLQTFSTAIGGSDWRNAVVFILLFVVLLFRPQGLLGEPDQTRA